MNKKLIITIVVVIVVAILGYIFIIGNSMKPGSKDLIIAEGIDIDIQTPHPYLNSDSNRDVVWSYTLEYPDATLLRLHFNRFEIKYEEITAPTVFEEVDYGECDLNAPKGYERKLIDPNTIQETQIVEQKPGELSVGSSRLIKCGIVEEKKEYTDQEIFDNNWVGGDFLLVKDKDGNVLDIITKKPSHYESLDFWSDIYHVDTIILELYADNKENAYGFRIDKYSRGFTDEERRIINEQRLEQYYKDCEERGIPVEKCPIPK